MCVRAGIRGVVIALTASLGCGQSGPSGPGSAIVSTSITPSLDSLHRLDAPSRLVARSRTSQGPAIGNYAWTISDTAVLQGVSIPPDTFELRARGEGAAFVRVFEQGGTRDSARVVVRQVILGIGVSPAFAYRGCAVQLVAHPTDSSGHPIMHPVNVTLTSLDTTRGTISPGGFFTALATGIVTVNASAEGVTTPTGINVTAAPPFLVGNIPNVTIQIGAGQYATVSPRGESPIGAPLTLFFHTSDSTIVRVPLDTDAVQAGYQIGNGTKIVGVRPGTAGVQVLTCDVPSDSVTIRVTTPHIMHSPIPPAARTDDPPWVVHLDIGDSVGALGATYATQPLHVVATDTATIHPDSSYVHVPADQYEATSTLKWASHGTARVVFGDTAGRYAPDTTAPVIVTFPPLLLSVVNDTLAVGMRQQRSVALGVDRTVKDSALTVHVASSDTIPASVQPTTLSMAVGTTGGPPLVFTGHDTIGATRITASAYRHEPAGVTVIVDHPQLIVVAPVTGIPHYPGEPPGDVVVVATDSLSFYGPGGGGAPIENVTAHLVSSDATIASLDSSTLTIPAGSTVSGTAHLSFNAPGTVTITASDPRPAFYKYRTGSSLTVTIVPKRLVFSEAAMQLGIGQYWSDGVAIEGRIPTDLVVTLAHTNPAVARLDLTTVTLPSTGPFGPVPLHGRVAGVDTVFATAPGWIPDTLPVIVGLGTTTLVGWPTTLAQGDSASVYLTVNDILGDGRIVDSATVFTLTPNARLSFSNGTSTLSSITVPAGGETSGYFFVKAIANGTGTVDISNVNYQTLTKSLSVP